MVDGRKLEADSRKRRQAGCFLVFAIGCAALPSCQDSHFSGAGTLQLPFSAGSGVQEGVLTLNDGDGITITFAKPYESPPRMAIVEFRQSKFDRKPFAVSDIEIMQWDATSFTVRNNHPEIRLGSWATFKWRAEGILRKSESKEAGAAGENRKLTPDQLVARIKQLGGTVTLAAQLPNSPIVAVDLHHTRAGDVELEGLENLKTLRTLNLYGTRVTDAGLFHVAGLTSLTTLYLNNTAVSDAGMRHLLDLTNLNELGLNETQVTDDGLAYVGRLTELRSLTLGGKQITDAGLLHLRELHNLKQLTLGHTSVTAAGIQDLKAALPKVQIVR